MDGNGWGAIKKARGSGSEGGSQGGEGPEARHMERTASASRRAGSGLVDPTQPPASQPRATATAGRPRPAELSSVARSLAQPGQGAGRPGAPANAHLPHRCREKEAPLVLFHARPHVPPRRASGRLPHLPPPRARSPSVSGGDDDDPRGEREREMRTRSGSLYSNNGGEVAVGQKRMRTAPPMGQSAVAGECAGGGRRKRLVGGPDYLDVLPDDLVLSILSKLAASASAPSDLLSVHLTCKRLNELGRHDMVFAKASPASLAVKAAAWSEPAQRFLKRCADAGNLEACYILGVIRFYCLGSRSSGAALLARAAVGGHAAALYSLAVIQFNGSGGAKSDRDLRAGAALDGDGDGAELRLCSHVRCGRRETRRHEFRRCSVCGAANYCSRACQALDWKRAHKAQCVPMDRWLLAAANAGEAAPQ
ncbi:F-box protein [Panicum miliaceum]|uniref:F-box protein n=1 Tax=Panicum miliaceum TaxID=4540 RepID=A0A3L6SMW3_PANMI|nr:F-box protein [Panicum miliaceum]